MSMKVKLIIDDIPTKKMEGYISNDDGYKIRDNLFKSMVAYRMKSKNISRLEAMDNLFSSFYEDSRLTKIVKVVKKWWRK